MGRNDKCSNEDVVCVCAVYLLYSEYVPNVNGGTKEEVLRYV